MMFCVVLLALAVSESGTGREAELVIQSLTPTALQFELIMGDEPVDAHWGKFIERFCTVMDVNHDGRIDSQEAAGFPVLTNPAGQPIRFDLDTADSNQDKWVNAAEVADFYQSRRIGGVQHIEPTADPSAVRISDALWKRLDLDHDDRLSLDELNRAPLLLNRWDTNEDERLAPNEIVDLPATDEQARPLARWRTAEEKSEASSAGFAVRIQLDQLDRIRKTEFADDIAARPEMEKLDESRLRVSSIGTSIIIEVRESSVQRIAAAQQYLMGEINTARAGQSELISKDLNSDPGLEWLLPLQTAADRNGDKRLDEQELQSIVTLLAEGAAAEVSLQVSVRGRSLFDALDANADQNLDYRELVAAGRRMANRSGAQASQEPRTFTPADLPLSLVVSVGRGPVSGRFGRLRIAKRPAPVLRSTSSRPDLPRWFRALDRNHDDLVTPSEFHGTEVQFRQLDRNSDGAISADEVEKD